MKKSVYLLGLILALVSCAQETAEVSNSTAIENSNLEELNAQKTSYTQQIEELTSKLETVNTAIAALGGSEKRALITAFATETSLFEHNIEVQANIKTRQNVLMYPEFTGRLIKLYVSEGQSVKKGALLAVIDDAGIQDQLEQMQLQLELAKTTFERTQRLWEQQIGSEMMFLEAQTRPHAPATPINRFRTD